MFSGFHCGCCSSDCLLGYERGYSVKFSRSFLRNILTLSLGLLNLVQVDSEVTERRTRVDYIESLQGLLSITEAES